jgi:hypothetical protein
VKPLPISKFGPGSFLASWLSELENAFMLLVTEVLKRRENIERQKQPKTLLHVGEDIGKKDGCCCA